MVRIVMGGVFALAVLILFGPVPAVSQNADDDDQPAFSTPAGITAEDETMFGKLSDYAKAHHQPFASADLSLSSGDHGVESGEVYWRDRNGLIIRRAYFTAEGTLICDQLTPDYKVMQTLNAFRKNEPGTLTSYSYSHGPDGRSYVSHIRFYGADGYLRGKIDFDPNGIGTKGEIFDDEGHRTGSWISDDTSPPPPGEGINPCPPVASTQVVVTDEKTNQPVANASVIVQSPSATPQVATTAADGKATVSVSPGDKVTVDAPGHEPKTQTVPSSPKPTMAAPVEHKTLKVGDVFKTPCTVPPVELLQRLEDMRGVKINRQNLPQPHAAPKKLPSGEYWCEWYIIDYLDGTGATTVATDGPGEIAEPRKGQQQRPDDALLLARGDVGQWWARAIGLVRSDGSSVVPAQGSPVIVAVVDSGVDFSHPELRGTMWRNAKETPRNRKDDDNNGYVDDVAGWNFVNNTADIRDDNGHGTFVAGVIAAKAANGIGIMGVNPWAKIMAVKVDGYDNRGDSFALADGIMYAADNGARVINVSIGGQKITRHERRAIDYAAQKGALVVVAAGNNGVDTAGFSPAGIAGALVVAAVKRDLTRAGYSNWGANVALAAPGNEIVSLRAGSADLMIFEKPDYIRGSAIVDGIYYQESGTSFAAPMVSGAASLLMSVNPRLTAVEVRRMLLQSAHDIDVPGRDQNTGYGLLDIGAALKADPNFFVEASIEGLAVAKADGKTVVRVRGTAAADRFKTAWIEIGQGDDPQSWTRSTASISKPVNDGVIADLDPVLFKAAKQWTIKLVAEHANGTRREARIKLNLG